MFGPYTILSVSSILLPVARSLILMVNKYYPPVLPHKACNKGWSCNSTNQPAWATRVGTLLQANLCICQRLKSWSVLRWQSKGKEWLSGTLVRPFPCSEAEEGTNAEIIKMHKPHCSSLHLENLLVYRSVWPTLDPL